MLLVVKKRCTHHTCFNSLDVRTPTPYVNDSHGCFTVHTINGKHKCRSRARRQRHAIGGCLVSCRDWLKVPQSNIMPSQALFHLDSLTATQKSTRGLNVRGAMCLFAASRARLAAVSATMIRVARRSQYPLQIGFALCVVSHYQLNPLPARDEQEIRNMGTNRTTTGRDCKRL